MADETDTTLKVVAEVTTRPQTNLNQMTNWTSAIEGWATNKVDELVASYTGTVTDVTTGYRMKITNAGIDSGDGERHWELYPKQTVEATVDDPNAWALHLDSFVTDLRAEIESALASAPVVARMTILTWHLHYSTGSVDKVV